MHLLFAKKIFSYWYRFYMGSKILKLRFFKVYHLVPRAPDLNKFFKLCIFCMIGRSMSAWLKSLKIELTENCFVGRKSWSDLFIVTDRRQRCKFLRFWPISPECFLSSLITCLFKTTIRGKFYFVFTDPNQFKGRNFDSALSITFRFFFLYNVFQGFCRHYRSVMICTQLFQ